MPDRDLEPRSEFDRGYAAAETVEFRRHFVSLNGSVAKTGQELALLRESIRELAEEARADKQATAVRVETLAQETERRRATLADTAAQGDRKFTRGQALAAIALGAAGVGLSVAVALL